MSNCISGLGRLGAEWTDLTPTVQGLLGEDIDDSCRCDYDDSNYDDDSGDDNANNVNDNDNDIHDDNDDDLLVNCDQRILRT